MKDENYVEWEIYAYKSGRQGRVNLGDVETSVRSAIMALDTPWKSGILLAMEIPWGIGCLQKIPRKNKL